MSDLDLASIRTYLIELAKEAGHMILQASQWQLKTTAKTNSKFSTRVSHPPNLLTALQAPMSSRKQTKRLRHSSRSDSKPSTHHLTS